MRCHQSQNDHFEGYFSSPSSLDTVQKLGCHSFFQWLPQQKKKSKLRITHCLNIQSKSGMMSTKVVYWRYTQMFSRLVNADKPPINTANTSIVHTICQRTRLKTFCCLLQFIRCLRKANIYFSTSPHPHYKHRNDTPCRVIGYSLDVFNVFVERATKISQSSPYGHFRINWLILACRIT